MANITNGKKLEWSICYYNSKLDNELQERINKYSNLTLFNDEPLIKENAIKASNLLDKYNTYHANELEIRGNPEPKTDIIQLDNNKNIIKTISVKSKGDIQILSAEGKTISKILRLIDKNISYDIIKAFEELPTKLINEKNINKAKKRKYNIVSDFFINDKLLDKYNWKIWEKENKIKYLELLNKIFKDDEIYISFLEESLTGKKLFRYNPYAAANYILTPEYFKKIDKEYLYSVKDKIKIDLRAKARAGISAAAIRIDLKE